VVISSSPSSPRTTSAEEPRRPARRRSPGPVARPRADQPGPGLRGLVSGRAGSSRSARPLAPRGGGVAHRGGTPGRSRSRCRSRPRSGPPVRGRSIATRAPRAGRPAPSGGGGPVAVLDHRDPAAATTRRSCWRCCALRVVPPVPTTSTAGPASGTRRACDSIASPPGDLLGGLPWRAARPGNRPTARHWRAGEHWFHHPGRVGGGQVGAGEQPAEQPRPAPLPRLGVRERGGRPQRRLRRRLRRRRHSAWFVSACGRSGAAAIGHPRVIFRETLSARLSVGKQRSAQRGERSAAQQHVGHRPRRR